MLFELLRMNGVTQLNRKLFRLKDRRLQEPLKYEQNGPVVILTMTTPETRNALSGEATFSAFEHSVQRINADFSVVATILTGEGPAFCSGGNIHEMRSKSGMFAGTPRDIESNYRSGVQRIPRALAGLDVPLIAAVNGPAIGAGCDLACMCDIRIASERAVFAENFVKLGLISGDGGSWLLQRAIGYSRAAEMAFTGDTLDAHAALQAGLVSRVVAPEDLLEQAMALANRIAKNPSQAVRWTKRLLRQAMYERLEEVLETAAALQALAHHTEEHETALAAIYSKRSAGPKMR
jgi:enoyl-CoA hydratase/carnithine racemase